MTFKKKRTLSLILILIFLATNFIAFGVGISKQGISNQHNLETSTITGSFSNIKLISEGFTNTSDFPDILCNKNDDVIIAWQNVNISTLDDYDIYSRIFNSTTSTWQSTDLISPSLSKWSKYPSLSMNDNGRTYITWQDDTSKFGPNDMGSDNDVFYRYLQDDLTWFGTIFFINTSSNSENPSMAFVGTDRKVVWEETNTTTDHDIYYQNGASPIPLLNDKRTAENPQIACDSDGNIHVVWTDDSNVSGWQLDPDIFYRFYNESSSTWSDVSLVSSGTQYAAMNPKIDLDSDGNAHIIWHEWTSSFPSYHYIKYRSWNKATNSWSSEYIIASANNNQVDNPDIAVDKNDNIYVVWDDSISYTSLGDDSVGDRDILMKIFDRTTSQWGDNLLISIGSNESSLCPCIDTDSNGKAHIVWADRAESLLSSGKDDDIFYVTFTATPPDSGPNNGIPFGNTFILVILISVISIVSIQIKKLNRKI